MCVLSRSFDAVTRSMNTKKSDQASVIKRLILQHVMRERLDCAALVEKIQSHDWVIMTGLPGEKEEENEAGQLMCEVVHGHGEFAIVKPTYSGDAPYQVGHRQFIIHLSRWSEFFVEWHTDYYDLAGHMGGGTTTELIAKKE